MLLLLHYCWNQLLHVEKFWIDTAVWQLPPGRSGSFWRGPVGRRKKVLLLAVIFETKRYSVCFSAANHISGIVLTPLPKTREAHNYSKPRVVVRKTYTLFVTASRGYWGIGALGSEKERAHLLLYLKNDKSRLLSITNFEDSLDSLFGSFTLLWPCWTATMRLECRQSVNVVPDR